MNDAERAHVLKAELLDVDPAMAGVQIRVPVQRYARDHEIDAHTLHRVAAKVYRMALERRDDDRSAVYERLEQGQEAAVQIAALILRLAPVSPSEVTLNAIYDQIQLAADALARLI